MDNSILLHTSEIFAESNLVDCLRQLYIDFEDDQDEEEIKDFLTKCKKYLDGNLPINTLIEFMSTILSCFIHFPNASLQFVNEFLKNSKSNENYIILTATLLSNLINDQPQLELPDYHSFVSSALEEILPQLSNESQLIIFGHEIPIQFKNNLIINLLLCENITEKLNYGFLQYLFSVFFTEKNRKFELLIQKVIDSNTSKILPQTNDSINELYEFITNKNFAFISKMSRETFSLFECAVMFTKSSGLNMPAGISKETILPFAATVSLLADIQSENVTFSEPKMDSLILEGVNYFQSNDSQNLTSFIDLILNDYHLLCLSNFISIENSFKILEIFTNNLLEGQYMAKKTVLINAIFDLSNNFDCEGISEQIKTYFSKYGMKIIKYIIENSEVFFNGIENKLNLDLFESNTIVNFIQNSEDTCKVLLFIEKLCTNKYKPIIQQSDENSLFLKTQLDTKIEEEKWDDVLLICKFMERNNFLNDIENIKQRKVPDFIEQTFFEYIPKEDESIDDILSHILSDPEPEHKDEMFQFLFNKMMEDDALCQINLCFLIFKYYIPSYDLLPFIRCYLKAYRKYKGKFIDVVKKVFDIKKESYGFVSVLKKIDFSIYSLPKSELGDSIVSKLFKSISEKENNFQAFVCLKNIANTFPFLFNNRHQEIFEIVFPYLNDFPLLFEENNQMNENKIKTAYSSFSFLLSTFQLPITVDHFIETIATNITKYTDPQIACFISALNYLYNDNILSLVIQALFKKFNFYQLFESLLKREISINDSFGQWYKETIYSFIDKTCSTLISLNRNLLIQIDEIQIFDNVLSNYYDKIFISYLTQFFEKKYKIKNVNYFANRFMNNLDKIRDFWIIYDHFHNRENYEDGVYESFINDIGFDNILNFKWTYPQRPDSYTIKMVRYLIMQPCIIYSFYLFKENVNLVPYSFDLLQKVDQHLKEIEMDIEENPDDEDNQNISKFRSDVFMNPLFNQKSIQELFINQIFQNSMKTDTFNSLLNAIKSMANCGSTFINIIQLISQNLNEIYNNDILSFDSSSIQKVKKSIDVLKIIQVKTSFKNHFFDSCCSDLLDFALSPNWRIDSELQLKTAELLLKANKIPVRAAHLIAFILMMKNEKAIMTAFKLIERLNENQLNYIKDIIINYIDSKESINIDILRILVNVMPSFIKTRCSYFATFLCTQLEQYSKSGKKDEESLKFISALFNILSPDRDKSLSTTRVITDSSIPQKIRDLSPIFWDIFERYETMIFDIIKKDPLKLDQFSFLLRFPELIDFNTRSSYFRKKMKAKIKPGCLEFTIERQNLLETSFTCLKDKTKDELLRRFRIEFKDESGMDASGLTREWFNLLAKEIFNQNYGLFNCSINNCSYLPNSLSGINPNHLEYFKFAGTFIARALIQGQCIDAHLTTSFLKQILKRQPDLEDLQDFDSELYKQMKSIMNEDVTNCGFVFAINKDDLGANQMIPLIENGENIEVTNENKYQFVNLRMNYSFHVIIKDQLKAFIEGFDSLIDHNEIRIFTPCELDLLICGVPNIDVEDFKQNMTYQSPYNSETEVIKMFFRVISGWDNEKKAKLLSFMTGSSRVPANGFREFCEMSGNPLLISPGGDESKLPSAHTCSNTLCLPEYTSEEVLNDKVIFAIYNVNTFEFL